MSLITAIPAPVAVATTLTTQSNTDFATIPAVVRLVTGRAVAATIPAVVTVDIN